MIRPRPTPRFVVAGSALALVLGLAGCGGDAQPIARVGTSTITRADYLAAAAGASAQYPAEAEPAKAMLIEDLVRRRLLVLSGRQRGMFEDTLAVNFRRLKEEELLIQALGRALTPTGNGASEAEMRRLYAWRDSAARVQVVYAFTRAAGEAIAREARAGADFAELANRFNPPGMIPPGGDIGPQAPGNLLDPLDEPVRTAAPGSIVGPLESPNQGWFVLRIGERQANPQPAFEDARRSLADMIRSRKRSASVIRAVRKLRESYALHVLPGGPQVLHAYLNLPEGETPAYSPEELSRPLAQWESASGRHVYTFAEAMHDLTIPDREKPNAMLLPTVEQWILAESGRRVQVLEARRRGLDVDPAFVRQLDETVNNYVLESLYQLQVAHEATLGPTDVIEAYERNRGRYETLEGVTLQVIDFADSAAALAFAAQAAQGGDLHAAAARMPESPPVQDLDVRFPNPDPAWQQIREPLGSMGEGQSAGPFRAGEAWRILLVVLKRTRVTPLESLGPNDRAMLEQEGLELARERRLMSFVGDLRREFPVAIDTARVRKLPWPVGPQGM